MLGVGLGKVGNFLTTTANSAKDTYKSAKETLLDIPEVRNKLAQAQQLTDTVVEAATEVTTPLKEKIVDKLNTMKEKGEDLAENALLETLSKLNRQYPVQYNGVAQFNAIDTDGNGSISLAEFTTAFPGDVAKFKQCDATGDGTLDIAEFINCMKLAQGGRSSSRKHKYTNKLRNSRRSRSY
jgi:Ca2+-binding EF-hand superfamily protein